MIEYIFVAYIGLLVLIGTVFATTYKGALGVESKETPIFMKDAVKVMEAVKSGKVILVDPVTKERIKAQL